MSKNKRLLSILLSALVLLTMSGTGVFAANNVDVTGADTDAVTMDAQSVDATDAVDEELPDFEAQATDLSEAVIEFLEKSGDDGITWPYIEGQKVEPAVQVTLGGAVLQEGQDYTLTYENNDKVSEEGHEAYAVITAVEGSAYTGTAKAVFFIEEVDDVDLEDPNVEIEDIDEQVYTGSAIEPKPAVTYEGKTLVEGTHYTLSYANNVELSTDDVMATVTITAIEGSGFTGSVTAEFRIVDELPALSSVKHLDAMAGCESITLTWDPVEGADTYLIWRTDQKWGSKAQGYYWPRDLRSLPSSRNKWDKISKNPSWANHNKGTVDIYKKYTYKVYAARYVEGATTAGKGQVKIGKQIYEVSQVKTIKKKCVSKLRITVRVHSGTTLTSRDGKNKHLTVRSGDKIVTDGYGAGCYYFTKKDARFRIMNERVSATNADYLKEYDYTKKEAEYFINNGDYLKYARPKSTSKKYFIWVSTYTQHVYAFKKSGGKWKLIRDWHCSSGDKNTPSPNGNKELWKKIRYRHSTDYWNCFSTLNALHGIKPISAAGYDWTRYLGQIKSGGCVRNLDKNAGWIYKNVPTGTKILVY